VGECVDEVDEAGDEAFGRFMPCSINLRSSPAG
jgi:hypothetical protein